MRKRWRKKETEAQRERKNQKLEAEAGRKTEAGQKEGLQQAGGGGRGEARVCWRPGPGQPLPWRPMSTCIQRPSLVLSTSSPEPHPILAFLSRSCRGTRPREEAVLACALSTPSSASLVLTSCVLSSQLLVLSGSWCLQRV